MKNAKETTRITLETLQGRVREISRAHAMRKDAWKAELSREIRGIPRARLYQVQSQKASAFSTSWLPGPLSYPWLVMLSSIPQILEQLFRQS